MHILYLDPMILPFLLFSSNRFLRKIKITATLHWYPNKGFKLQAINKLLADGILNHIVVHGQNIQKELIRNLTSADEKTISSVEYPHKSSKILNKNVCKKKLGIIDKGPFVMFFGGLRYDKGIVEFLDAVKRIRSHLTVIIAGKLSDLSQSYIEKQKSDPKLKGRVVWHVGYVPDELVNHYFGLADIVVLPYRKTHKGQSGPLIEGINQLCLILGPDCNQIGYTIRHENVGVVYSPEDYDNFVEKLDYMLKNIEELKMEKKNNLLRYRKRTSLESFKKRYIDLLASFSVE